jgi:hypothetical protein
LQLRERISNPSAQRQAGQRVEAHGLSEEFRLEPGHESDQPGLRLLEGFNIRLLARPPIQDAVANLANRIVHGLMHGFYFEGFLRIQLFELVFLSGEPMAKAAECVGVDRQHILPGRGVQDSTTHHTPSPVQMCLDRLIQLDNEAFRFINKIGHALTSGLLD